MMWAEPFRWNDSFLWSVAVPKASSRRVIKRASGKNNICFFIFIVLLIFSGWIMNKLSWSVGLTRMIRKRCNHWINLKTCSGTFLLAHLRWFPFSHFCNCGESAGALWERWISAVTEITHRSDLWEIITSGLNESFSIFRKVKNLKRGWTLFGRVTVVCRSPPSGSVNGPGSYRGGNVCCCKHWSQISSLWVSTYFWPCRAFLLLLWRRAHVPQDCRFNVLLPTVTLLRAITRLQPSLKF